MYRLFSTPTRGTGKRIAPPRFLDVERKTLFDIERITEHYRRNSFAARGDHLLIRLMDTMNVPMHYDDDRFYSVASARTYNVANVLGLTSSINPGEWRSGVFYHGCQELILVYNGMDRPGELLKVWEDLEPVRVLEHPVTNMHYMLPNGVKHNTETGLAVISIDVPMLLLQYRAFLNHQRTLRDQGLEATLDSRHFLYRYVFPNMLKSQTDLVLFNRMMNLHYGAPMGDSTRRHRFHLSDYTGLLDRAYDPVLDRIEQTKMSYPDVLAQIPSIYRDHPLQMPDIAETRQVWWALFLTRVRQMRFLWDVGGPALRHYNQAYINELQIDLKRFRSDNIFKQRVHPLILEQLDHHLYVFTKES